MTRYTNLGEKKESGATFTPANLAEFVANQLYSKMEIPKQGPIALLDPAVGDGALLEALIRKFPKQQHKRLVVHGFDTSGHSLSACSDRLLDHFPLLELELNQVDFLSLVHNKQDLFSQDSLGTMYDGVIANPPYVRTQILGAHVTQELASSFGLTGRVDLYYPFLLSISDFLKESGTMGVITSNRFMTTRSGKSVRRQMIHRFELFNIWDLGDTKLFEAAVLPAVMIARPRTTNNVKLGWVGFTKVYETKSKAGVEVSNILDALEERSNGVVKVPDGRCFEITSGYLCNGDEEPEVWRVANDQENDWLHTVESHTWARFGEKFNIRVGVKTTADKVFIKNDWDVLPEGSPELIRPLLTRHHAQRFRPKTPTEKFNKNILYPHESINGKRSAVDLDAYPLSKRYLESFREQLESREYVINAGRKWYEIWVPQDPAAWDAPKVVFPDISERPIFFFDDKGYIVNGECYWMQPRNHSDTNLLWLVLAVANSNFIVNFYDKRFGNKLYAGRRRFITQYVEKFPLPDPNSKWGSKLILLAKKLYDNTDESVTHRLEEERERTVRLSFGLSEELGG